MLFETCFLWYVMHLMLASFAFFFTKNLMELVLGGLGKPYMLIIGVYLQSKLHFKILM